MVLVHERNDQVTCRCRRKACVLNVYRNDGLSVADLHVVRDNNVLTGTCLKVIARNHSRVVAHIRLGAGRVIAATESVVLENVCCNVDRDSRFGDRCNVLALQISSDIKCYLLAVTAVIDHLKLGAVVDNEGSDSRDLVLERRVGVEADSDLAVPAVSDSLVEECVGSIVELDEDLTLSVLLLDNPGRCYLDIGVVKQQPSADALGFCPGVLVKLCRHGPVSVRECSARVVIRTKYDHAAGHDVDVVILRFIGSDLNRDVLYGIDTVVSECVLYRHRRIVPYHAPVEVRRCYGELVLKLLCYTVEIRNCRRNRICYDTAVLRLTGLAHYSVRAVGCAEDNCLDTACSDRRIKAVDQCSFGHLCHIDNACYSYRTVLSAVEHDCLEHIVLGSVRRCNRSGSCRSAYLNRITLSTLNPCDSECIERVTSADEAEVRGDINSTAARCLRKRSGDPAEDFTVTVKVDHADIGT